MDRLTKRLCELRTTMRHAFSLSPLATALSGEDLALLERIAEVLVRRGMAAPAAVFLESMGPMSYLGSQALHVLAPIIDCAFDAKEVEQVARLLERRDTVSRLIAIVEAKSSAQRASAR
jgi:hypothetical protein